MSVTPFLIVALLFFGFFSLVGITVCRMNPEPSHRYSTAFLIFMTVWAAGLLLRPAIN